MCSTSWGEQGCAAPGSFSWGRNWVSTQDPGLRPGCHFSTGDQEQMKSPLGDLVFSPTTPNSQSIPVQFSTPRGTEFSLHHLCSFLISTGSPLECH